jgi:hypothetical protein
VTSQLVRYQLRRDSVANWTTNNPTLLVAELGFETDTGRLKIGDGSTAWASLDYLDADIIALAAEIAAARGDRSTVGKRIDTISNFASPNAGGVVVGRFYDNAFQGTNGSTEAGTANRCDLAPFYTSQRLRIDQIGAAVTTGVASALAKTVIYGSNAEGWPDELLYESGNLGCATTGYKFDTLDFTFDSGRQYWLGLRTSSTATFRAINVSSAVNLGLPSNAASNYATILRRTITFANAAPDPWVFNASELVSDNVPSIRMRAAALP